MRNNSMSKDMMSVNKINKRKEGGIWEKYAGSRIKESGMKIICYNFQCRLGEIDIVARDGDCLVFVEVKCRKTANTGNPLEAVTPYKQKTIRKVAEYYMLRYGMGSDTYCRFDVFGIEVRGKGDDIREYWVKNAF